MMKSELEIVAEVLASREWFLSVEEYGLTHQRMRVSFHSGNWLDRRHLICHGCVRFCGFFRGGPYSMSVEATTIDRQEFWELRSACGAFRLTCADVVMVGSK